MRVASPLSKADMSNRTTDTTRQLTQKEGDSECHAA
jgi:hypothetical protein